MNSSSNIFGSITTNTFCTINANVYNYVTNNPLFLFIIYHLYSRKLKANFESRDPNVYLHLLYLKEGLPILNVYGAGDKQILSSSEKIYCYWC